MKKLIYQRHSPRSISVAVCTLSAIAVLALCATSCNVTRRMTTESSYIQKGDTNVVIITKTIESYDARKNAP